MDKILVVTLQIQYDAPPPIFHTDAPSQPSSQRKACVKAYKLKYIKDRRVSWAKGINADKGTKIQKLHELIKR